MREHNPSPPTVKLSRGALAFRTFHAAIAVEQLLAIAYVWWCVLSRRRDRLLRIAVATLIGAVLTLGAITAAGLVLLVVRGPHDVR